MSHLFNIWTTKRTWSQSKHTQEHKHCRIHLNDLHTLWMNSNSRISRLVVGTLFQSRNMPSVPPNIHLLAFYHSGILRKYCSVCFRIQRDKQQIHCTTSAYSRFVGTSKAAAGHNHPQSVSHRDFQLFRPSEPYQLLECVWVNTYIYAFLCWIASLTS